MGSLKIHYKEIVKSLNVGLLLFMVLSLDLKKQNQKKNQNCVFYCEHQYKKINAFIISQPVGEADSLFFLLGLELM